MLGDNSSTEEITTITEDEANIYDRQIRLWGLGAQKRLRTCRVLVIGLGGIGSEIAKNTILAGVKSIHFMDDSNVSDRDLHSQVFVRREDVGSNRALASIKNAQLLNPMVEVTAECSGIREKAVDFFRSYDIVCANDLDWSTGKNLDACLRKQGIKLFMSSCFGLYGYMLADLGTHDYSTEVRVLQNQEEKKVKTEEVETRTVKESVEYQPLEKTFDFEWSNEKNAAKLKKTPTGFFLCRVISEFITKNKRIPELESIEEDRKELEEIRMKVLKELNIDENYIPLEYFSECYGSVSPACAVLGGIVAQDVIKAASRRDLPHNNFFFFDGINGCGMVDEISTR